MQRLFKLCQKIHGVERSKRYTIVLTHSAGAGIPLGTNGEYKEGNTLLFAATLWSKLEGKNHQMRSGLFLMTKDNENL